MPGGKEYAFLPKVRATLHWSHKPPSVNFYVAEQTHTVIPLLQAQPEVVRPLLQKWSNEIAKAQEADPSCQELGPSDRQASPGRIHYQLQQDVWYRGVPSKYGGFNYQVVVPAALDDEVLVGLAQLVALGTGPISLTAVVQCDLPLLLLGHESAIKENNSRPPFWGLAVAKMSRGPRLQ
uniref:Uncharacterized protein n=1 Tax=Knipowitschia caucasica TaxID=637954 RepID=A0AAV2J6M6_KNICA